MFLSRPARHTRNLETEPSAWPAISMPEEIYVGGFAAARTIRGDALRAAADQLE